MTPVIVLLAGNSGLGLMAAKGLLEARNFIVASTFRRHGDELWRLYERSGLDPTELTTRVDLLDYDALLESLKSFGSLGRVWGVVNLSGVASAQRLMRIHPSEAVEGMIANILPALNATKAAGEVMAAYEPGGGRIVHISSVTVKRPVVGTVPYVMSKAAIEGLVKSAAVELGGHGITVNALRLGYFDGGMARRDVPEKLIADILQRTPMRSLGSSESLVWGIRYLMAESASFQTGAVIDLDGGLT